MSGHFDWAKAKQRDRGGYVPPPSGASLSATRRQRARLHALDPSISKAWLKSLNYQSASEIISLLLERTNGENAPAPVLVPSGVDLPATAKQLRYLQHLDPTIPWERLATLDRVEASVVIARLLRAAKAAEEEPTTGEAGGL